MTPAQTYCLIDRRAVDLEREDFRTGIVASTIANVHRGKDTKAFKPEDFMPKPKEEASPEQSPEEMLRAFQILMGNRIVQK